MPSNNAAPLLSVDLSEDAVAGKQVEKTRQIRREAMRRWRADPLHKAMELKKTPRMVLLPPKTTAAASASDPE